MPWVPPGAFPGMKYKDPVTGEMVGVFRGESPGSPALTLPVAQNGTPSPASSSSGTGTRSSSSGSRSSSAGSRSGPSSAQRKAAANLGSIAGFNATTAKRQYDETIRNYDISDEQNRELARVQKVQNSRKGASDRFGQAKKMQASVSSMRNAAGNALQGSGTYGIIDMLRGRTDIDNNEVWNTLHQNQNAVQNALDEALNANVLARNDARAATAASLRGIEADTAAQLNNIDPSLYVAPGTGGASFGSDYYNTDSGRTPANEATMAGYFMPPPTTRVGTTYTGDTYFDQMLGSYGNNSYTGGYGGFAPNLGNRPISDGRPRTPRPGTPPQKPPRRPPWRPPHNQGTVLPDGTFAPMVTRALPSTQPIKERRY